MTADNDTAAPTDALALMERLRARVEERRASGAYPPELEHELDVHFRHIVEHRPARNLDALQSAMERFEAALSFDARMIPTGSSVPGGQFLHKGLAKLTTRQTDWVVERLREFAESVRVMLWKMIETLDAPTHVHGDLTAQIDAVLDRLAAYERAPGDTPALGALLARVEALEAAHAASTAPEAAAPEGLEDHRAMASLLEGCSPVLVIATSPGAAAMAEGLHAAGDVVHLVAPQEAAGKLAEAATATLGGIAIEVTEALGLEQICDWVALASDRLRPGGSLVLASSGRAGGLALHPAHLTFLLRQAGFLDVVLRGQEPPGSQLGSRGHAGGGALLVATR